MAKKGYYGCKKRTAKKDVMYVKRKWLKGCYGVKKIAKWMM
jgi:hypothetical protein